jgi:hypothetical protein
VKKNMRFPFLEQVARLVMIPFAGNTVLRQPPVLWVPSVGYAPYLAERMRADGFASNMNFMGVRWLMSMTM